MTFPPHDSIPKPKRLPEAAPPLAPTMQRYFCLLCGGDNIGFFPGSAWCVTCDAIMPAEWVV